MKNLYNLKKINTLLVLVSCVTIFTLGCGANNTSTKVEEPVVASKSVATNEVKEVKVSKPNVGGLKQELSTKAAVSSSNKNQITFEVPASQLQGLKVGDSLAINSGKNVYPAQILTIPPAQPAKPIQPAQPTQMAQQKLGSKVIITASVGPGVNLPGNNSDYTVTYLYNNRDTSTHYIKKDYVYYDGSRPYVYITGPDRFIIINYIRTGLINRYYAEILDELDITDRIVENYINDYINNVVVPEIIEDYTNQVVDAYQEYIDSLNQRWDYDEDVNSFTVDVTDVDWNKLEELDTILTDEDMIEIYDQIQTEDHSDDNSYQSNESNEGSSLYGNRDDDSDNDKKNDDKDNDDTNNVSGSNDRNDDGKDDVVASTDKDDDKEETSEVISYKSESNVEDNATTNDDDVNNITNNVNNNDSNNNTYDNASNDNDSQDNASNYNDSNDNSNNDDSNNNNDSNDNSNNDDSNNNNDSNDSNNEAFETTTIDDDNN